MFFSGGVAPPVNRKLCFFACAYTKLMPTIPQALRASPLCEKGPLNKVKDFWNKCFTSYCRDRGSPLTQTLNIIYSLSPHAHTPFSHKKTRKNVEMR